MVRVSGSVFCPSAARRSMEGAWADCEAESAGANENETGQQVEVAQVFIDPVDNLLLAHRAKPRRYGESPAQSPHSRLEEAGCPAIDQGAEGSDSDCASQASEAPEHIGTVNDTERCPASPKRLLRFLAQIGAHDSLLLGQDGTPMLRLGVQGHEAEQHRFYAVDVQLQLGGKGQVMQWRAPRRLTELRNGLHDPVKRALGPQEYDRFFGRSPFARSGRPPGTTARLDAWCAALADCVNAGGAPPAVLAQVVQFLADRRQQPNEPDEDRQGQLSGPAEVSLDEGPVNVHVERCTL